MLLRIFFFCCIFFSPLVFCLAQDVKPNSCVACHADMLEEMKGSIHSQHAILCNGCHGGDPSQKIQDLAHDPAKGYAGIPDKKQIAQICGGCHSDVEAMNFYGIRTDQLARYKSSMHGKKLLQEGDTKVAVCSDCHGYHDVTAVSDPNSPVYPLNLPKTCNHCHGNEKLMSGYNLPSDILKIYENSVHGKALFEKKDLSVAQCASCHGSHGALPPGVKEIGNACGKCHINEKKYLSESAHWPAAESGKFSECISCHGNHGVAPASVELFKQTCVKCHGERTDAVKLGMRLEDMIGGARKSYAAAEERVKQAGIEGFFVEEEMSMLEEAKTHVIEMAPLQHTLSETKIADHNKKVLETADEIARKIQNKRKNLAWRKFALIPIWIFILVMAWALWIKFQELKNKLNNGKGNNV